jgi:hypothetical protein
MFIASTTRTYVGLSPIHLFVETVFFVVVDVYVCWSDSVGQDCRLFAQFSLTIIIHKHISSTIRWSSLINFGVSDYLRSFHKSEMCFDIFLYVLIFVIVNINYEPCQNFLVLPNFDLTVVILYATTSNDLWLVFGRAVFVNSFYVW